VEGSETEGGRLARVALDEWGLQSLADQGDASAQESLGEIYFRGMGVAKDAYEAVAWFRKSAEQGYAEAQLDLGHAYRVGEGVDKNLKEAAGWFRKSAEQGDAQAQYWLGIAFRDGEGVDQNHREAVVWFRKPAEQGDVDAQFALGEAYRDADGVVKDEGPSVHSDVTTLASQPHSRQASSATLRTSAGAMRLPARVLTFSLQRTSHGDIRRSMPSSCCDSPSYASSCSASSEGPRHQPPSLSASTTVARGSGS
jgi:TPR repeat protein